MNSIMKRILLVLITSALLAGAHAAEENASRVFQFLPDGCTFSPVGNNPYFPLQPGRQLVLRGQEDGEAVELIWEVLSETRDFNIEINGVPVSFKTAIVRETETVNGSLVEISHNYFAECRQTGTVFYFGEEVDIYEGGKVVSHDGAWLAGKNGNEPGVIMPGRFAVGDVYPQEFAPGIAEDLGENVETGLSASTPAGNFNQVIEVEEFDPLDPEDEPSIKRYAPGVGLILDDILQLAEVRVPPALTIERAIRLTWPNAQGQFILESAPAVQGPWKPITVPVSNVMGGKEAWVVSGPNASFFRLRRQ